jgi:tetratricopeptide (TPR) repeat protein
MLRLLKISDATLRSWEKQNLISPSERYGFSQLLALRTLDKLRRQKMPSRQIRGALAALRLKLRHIQNPLTELRIYADGGRVKVELEGNRMEAISGQLLLDFSASELKRLVEFPDQPTPAQLRARRQQAEGWFQRGLDLEQAGGPPREIIEAYEKAVELDPNAAGALVNLGTLFFNGRAFKEAEQYYLRAIAADPSYALAYFDLANLYDEKGERARALHHYEIALRLQPNYADAHYNVALLYQGNNDVLKAVRHWKAYLKLDPSSTWASVARRELKRLRAEVMPGAQRTS